MQTLIYARYSDDKQNEKSVDDQLAECRERCEREGWTVAGEYFDEAISGAAGLGGDQRPGMRRLLDRLERGGVAQVIAESTNRISRHEGDGFHIREAIAYAGARLFTLIEGEIDGLKGAINGYMDADFRRKLAAQIKRGQKGTVKDGRVPAGMAYGYSRVLTEFDRKGELVRGLRSINPEQATIVRRIFEEYVTGISPRAIAERLNNEGVPGPRGNGWRGSVIGGDRVRFNGMLQNQIYAGVIIHNRTHKIVDRVTRKTLIKPNPESEWIRTEAPELRIISDELFEAAQARRAMNDGVRPERQRRAKHLLSGLGRCGVCGGGWSIISAVKWGCGANRDGGKCSNNRQIQTESYERRVLIGLKEKLLQPEAVEAFVQSYRAEHAARQRAEASQRGIYEREIVALDKRIKNLVEAIASGAGAVAEVVEALTAAKAERAAKADALKQIEASNVVALHPTLAEDYRRKVAELTDTLRSNPEAQLNSLPKLRAIIGDIIMTPAKIGRGVDIELHGRLHQMLEFAAGRPLLAERTVTDERVKGIGRYSSFVVARV